MRYHEAFDIGNLTCLQLGQEAVTLAMGAEWCCFEQRKLARIGIL